MYRSILCTFHFLTDKFDYTLGVLNEKHVNTYTLLKQWQYLESKTVLIK